QAGHADASPPSRCRIRDERPHIVRRWRRRPVARPVGAINGSLPDSAGAMKHARSDVYCSIMRIRPVRLYLCRLVSAIAFITVALPARGQDIDRFWKETLARLAREPMEAAIEDTREPLPYKKFRVEYRSLGGVRVRAFLALPVRGGEQPRPL